MWTKTLFGLDPVRVPPHVVGLDESRLVFVSLDADGEEAPSCRELAVEQLPESCFQAGPFGGTVRDLEGLGRALDALLARLTSPLAEASLVVPDDWVRLAIVETDAWPRGRDERDEIVRFKLKRSVPFRVSELRVAFETLPAVGGGDGTRLLVGFGVEAALAQLEDLFAGRGIRIGWISNRTLSLLEALRGSLARAESVVAVAVTGERYSVVGARFGQPVVVRGKSSSGDVHLAGARRELSLTRNFLVEKAGQKKPSEVLLVAPPGVEPSWRMVLEEVFECPVAQVSDAWRHLRGFDPLGIDEAAPLLGAGLREVA